MEYVQGVSIWVLLQVISKITPLRKKVINVMIIWSHHHSEIIARFQDTGCFRECAIFERWM